MRQPRTLGIGRPLAAPTQHSRSAIIDIGSNSVRLVVYQGPPRLPATIFNEKVLAGLGRGLASTGRIDDQALARAVTAVARFAAIAREMQVDSVRAVATAAVRDAENGADLIAAARTLGVQVELLGGEQEALAAGLGVLSAIPDADGIVADLGGGSLELARVSGGEVHARASFPFGVLRVAAVRAKGKGSLNRLVARALHSAGWGPDWDDKPLYLVGGTFRSLARLDMTLSGYPLPLIQGYRMTAKGVTDLRDHLREPDRDAVRRISGVSGARAATVGDGAALLSALVKAVGAKEMVFSAFGLREGLLFAALPPEVRAEDPLIVAARAEGERVGRFDQHGDMLDRWIAPLFADDPPDQARLRHAACLLAEVGWRANPEFRAESGVETALHGNWVAIDGDGRAILAQVLNTALSGDTASPGPLPDLADAAALARATCWGLAIRLGQRMSGGVRGPLERSALSVEGASLVLSLPRADRAFYGEPVERRHKALAAALGLSARLG